MLGQCNSGYVRLGQVRTWHVRLCQVISCYAMLGHIKSG
jgi:hypothetical protein